MDFVFASDHDEVLAQLARMRRTSAVFAALARQLACTTPRNDEWERNYRALQTRARQTLEALAEEEKFSSP